MNWKIGFASFSIALGAFVALQGTAHTTSAQDETRFEVNQKEGKIFILFAHSKWCSVCRKQEKILGKILKEPKFSNLNLIRVDYNPGAPLLKKHNITSQSTILVFKGNQELNRTLGVVSEAALREQLATALTL